ncbi:MAG: class I SAM-dependent methyltransferase [Geitlerinemataceae cyanobacterium]
MSTNWHSDKDLAAKKRWYSSVAEAYDRIRPKYPEKIVHRAIELAQLPANAKILEIGCGPGIATIDFARSGFSLLCLEPNWDMCQIARRNCQPYPDVAISNTAFEEWQPDGTRFDAVLAATSFHWVSAAVRYRKAAEVLSENGALILLWNVVPHPPLETHPILQPIYRKYAPSLMPEGSIETDDENMKIFGKSAIGSGYFQDLKVDRLLYEITYSTEDYLMLLGTLSPYLELEPSHRDSLFSELRETIEENLGGEMRLLHLCICQVARKR